MRVCGCRGAWTPLYVIEKQVEQIRALVGEHGRVICGISGGVDSAVAAAIVNRAIGERQICVFINNGLLREGEFELISLLLNQNMKLNLHSINAGQAFLIVLKGIIDPSLKLNEIGSEFIHDIII